MAMMHMNFLNQFKTDLVRISPTLIGPDISMTNPTPCGFIGRPNWSSKISERASLSHD
jgi:hypothetical protein